MAREDIDLRNASIVTIIARQGGQGSSAGENEAPNHENIPSLEAASCIQATTGAAEAAQTKFLVHENIICEASPVLKAAFQGNFAEAGSKSMTISDLDADMVHQFLKWLYCGKVLPVKPSKSDAEQRWYLEMAGLVVVADVLRVEGLEDDVMDMLVKHIKNPVKPPDWRVVEFVYANTCPLSCLRRWIVAWYTERLNWTWYQQLDIPKRLAALPELTSDLAIAFATQKISGGPKSFFKLTREERKVPADVESDSDSE